MDVFKLPERYSTQLALQMLYDFNETSYDDWDQEYGYCPRWDWVRDTKRVQAYIQGVQAGAEETAKGSLDPLASHPPSLQSDMSRTGQQETQDLISAMPRSV
jgi:choline dehydrogenase-like flavoprotein